MAVTAALRVHSASADDPDVRPVTRNGRVRADSRDMTKYRVHLMTDLTRLDEDGLADLLERLVEVGGVPSVPFGVLEVTGSTKAKDARAAVADVGRVLERALQAMNRPCRVIGVQAGEVGPYGS